MLAAPAIWVHPGLVTTSAAERVPAGPMRITVAQHRPPPRLRPSPLMTTAAPNDALLLCLDVQARFLPAMSAGPRTLRRCEFALAAATILGLPAAFTEQVPEKLGATEPCLRAAAADAPVWVKSTFSALADAAIREELVERRRIGHLLLCGLETPVCVYQTALGALAEGLQVTLLVDAIDARRPEDAVACLAALARAGVHLLPSEAVYYALLGGAEHPRFRDYTRLVKAFNTPPSA